MNVCGVSSDCYTKSLPAQYWTLLVHTAPAPSFLDYSPLTHFLQMLDDNKAFDWNIKQKVII